MVVEKDNEIDLKIGDLDNVIALLGQVYDDDRDAIAEFIKNSSDAKASQITIFLERKDRNPHIKISDNGFGMDYKELNRVAQSLGDSIKKYDPQTKGDKGIGILGFQAISEKEAGRCEIVSRSKDDPETNALILSYGKSKGVVRKGDKRRLVIPGTDVYLFGVGNDRFRRLTINKLEEYLKRKFRMDLLEETYQLWVTEGRKKILVRPEHYKGEPFYITSRRTLCGEIKFNLYILPISKDVSVAIYSKGNEVIPNITELDEFKGEPWNLGQIQGEITCDFVKQTTGRRGLVKDGKKYPVWVESVKGIEENLTEEIEKVSSEHKKKINQKMYSQLRKAFARAFSELPSFSIIPRVLVPSSIGNDVPEVPNQVDIRIDDKKAKRRKSEKEIIQDLDKEMTKAKPSTGLNWNDTEPFYDSPELRSEYSEKFQEIKINPKHPDYTKETITQERKIAYFCKLTAKEIALINYPQTSSENLLEKMIELELCVRRYL